MIFILYFLWFLLFLFLFAELFFIGYKIYRFFFAPGAFYYPSKIAEIQAMLKVAEVTKKDTVVDLGSGDGVILFEAAKLGAKAIGYEINPFLVKKTREKIKKLKLEHLVSVHLKNFWKVDFNEATVITLYCFPEFMNKLERVLNKKLTHPIRFVSNRYQFPRKKYFKKLKEAYLYKF